MDPLLHRFIHAATETESERELNVLIEEHALPLARTIVARKLRTYGGDRSGGWPLDDGDDVVADAMLTLVERLQASRTNPDRPPIENFAGYTASVVHSACAHQIRRRYPERARLKNRLRYVFSSNPRLALWTLDGEVTCGLALWRDRHADRAAERVLQQLVEQRPRPWGALAKTGLTSAVVDLVTSIGAAVDFDVFVGVVASASGVLEPQRGGEPSTLPSQQPSHDTVIDQRRSLERIWKEVQDLPVRQRIALLLNLRDAAGVGILWLLPVTGIATIRHIARVLEIPEAEFARLWRDIPLDDATIGARMGCNRQQVINLRMAARKRLTNRLVRGTFAPNRIGRGNLTAVSASVKDSA